jgi:hypothetical protein
MYLYLQDFVHRNLSELLNLHIFDDAGNTLGQVIVELGRAETYLIRCSRNQSGEILSLLFYLTKIQFVGSDLFDLPSEKGSTLYQLLSHPDEVNLESLPADVFTVSKLLFH